MPSLHLLLFAAMVPCFADAAETYRNPVIDNNLADPAVIRHDGTYYLYATGEVDGDNGYRVYTSSDLVNWKRGPVVFQPGERHIWAPDVWRDPDSGRFYLYYTANRTVGVADAEGPLGPFTVRRKLFDSAIDAHLFRDDDGPTVPLRRAIARLPDHRAADGQSHRAGRRAEGGPPARVRLGNSRRPRHRRPLDDQARWPLLPDLQRFGCQHAGLRRGLRHQRQPARPVHSCREQPDHPAI